MSASEHLERPADGDLRPSGGSAMPFTRYGTGISDRHRRERNRFIHPHGSQVRRRAVVEPLEGRSLLSALVASSTAAPAGQQVAIQVPSAYISDRVGTLDVTLQRSAQPGGPGAAATAQAEALLAQPLTVELSIVQGAPPNAGPVAIPGPIPASRPAALRSPSGRSPRFERPGSCLRPGPRSPPRLQ